VQSVLTDESIRTLIKIEATNTEIILFYKSSISCALFYDSPRIPKTHSEIYKILNHMVDKLYSQSVWSYYMTRVNCKVVGKYVILQAICPTNILRQQHLLNHLAENNKKYHCNAATQPIQMYGKRPFSLCCRST
jgi:hypothetical protein